MKARTWLLASFALSGCSGSPLASILGEEAAMPPLSLESAAPAAALASPAPTATPQPTPSALGRLEGETFAFAHPAIWERRPAEVLPSPFVERVNLQMRSQGRPVSFHFADGVTQESLEAYRDRVLAEAGTSLISLERFDWKGLAAYTATAHRFFNGTSYTHRATFARRGDRLVRADFYVTKDDPDQPQRLSELEALFSSWEWR